MKRTTLPAISLVVLLASCTGGAGGGGGSSVAAPQTDDEKTLYALGMILGRNLGSFNMTPQEIELVKKGLTDQALNKPTDVKLEEFGPKVQELARKRSMAKAESEKKSGAAFAEKAAQEAGAQKLPSGLVMKTEKEGTGASPTATDKVKVNYEGTLENGTVFDSSYKRNQPAEFQLNQVIPCWTEALQKMKVGGTAKLVCPASIAYGDMGRPGIPGGATLIFKVELLDIVAGGAGAPPAPTPAQSKMPPLKKK
jgi:FKBP-type peptidyl-prolyl cis-trans isomerase FkpA